MNQRLIESAQRVEYFQTLRFARNTKNGEFVSSNQITKEVVHKIADLAKLELTDKEIGDFAERFTAIFEHFQKLSKVNTEGIEPLVTPAPIGFAPREDVVQKGLGGERSLMNAPEKQGNLFKVPPVVG